MSYRTSLIVAAFCLWVVSVLLGSVAVLGYLTELSGIVVGIMAVGSMASAFSSVLCVIELIDGETD